MCPTPNPKLSQKFEFFYGPYNYVANTQKFITYDDIEVEEQRFFKLDPNQIDYELGRPVRSASVSGWRKVHDFLF